MPARRRRTPGGGAAPAPTTTPSPRTDRTDRKAAQQDAAKVFADRLQAEKEQVKAEARVRREAAERENRRRELVAAKDDAARRLKDVRRRDAPGAARAEAEAAYRDALTAVLRDEQGLPPLAPGELSDAPVDPAVEAEVAEPAGPEGDEETASG